MAYKYLYKVGDRVRVRSDLTKNARYRMAEGDETNVVTSSMMEHAGKIMVIADQHGGQYRIRPADKGEAISCLWVDGMFDGIVIDNPAKPVKLGDLKPGDKVRIRPDLEEGDAYGIYCNSSMEKMAGRIVTIRRHTGEGDGYRKYSIEEDGGDWTWTDKMFVPADIVELKVGDKVRVRPDIEDGKSYDGCLVISSMAKFAGRIVTIKEVAKGIANRYTIVESGDHFHWSSEMFVLDEAKKDRAEHEQEIVITTDGKKTTATYRNKGKVVVALSRCAPDDTFDFAEGAKIAFARLWDGEEEDEPKQEGYNGKIVCIQRGYNNISDPLLGLTVGKVYTVTDGRLTFDDGHTSACKYFTIEALCIGTGHKFIPLVE